MIRRTASTPVGLLLAFLLATPVVTSIAAVAVASHGDHTASRAPHPSQTGKVRVITCESISGADLPSGQKHSPCVVAFPDGMRCLRDLTSSGYDYHECAGGIAEQLGAGVRAAAPS
jgi:hypothetical protein